MTPVAAVPFYQTKTLEDVAAVAVGASGYLVTVERTFEMVPETAPGPTEKSGLRFWAPEREEGRFREASRDSAILPVARSIAMAFQRGGLMVVALTNQSWAACLLRADAPNLPKIAGFGQPVPLALKASEAEQVHLSPAATWSTQTLAPEGWLFHPSITPLPGSNDVAIAMNTADGHAVAWISDGTQIPARAAFLPGALNPVFLRRSGKNYLLYRPMPPDWPVYFHDLRYSGQYGPVALPLVMAELDATGAIAQAIDLSKDAAANRPVGAIFDFAAKSGPGNRLALAVIAGSKSTPELRVYMSADPGAALRLLRSAHLRAVPYRLTMASTEKQILLGLAYKGKVAYEVEGLTVAWD